MQSIVYYPGQGLILEEKPLPNIGTGEVLLQVEACGICGTDLLKIDRQLPKVPVVLGHELCGVVTQTGKGVSNFKPGDRMVVAHHVPCQSCHYCLHGNPSMCLHFKSTNLDPGGFSEYLRVPAQHVQHTAFKVPQKLKSEFALMTEPLSCCIRNIRRANLKKNDVVVIIGMGSIGLMSLQLLKLQECQVITLDLKEERRDLSLKLGADFSFTQADDAFTKSLEKISQGRGADLIIFTAGNHQLFSQSFQWIRNGGSLNLFASLKNSEQSLVNLDEIYHREIQIFSSYSPSLEDLKSAFNLIEKSQINLAPLMTHHLTFHQIEEGLELMRKQEALKVILRPKD